jgi:SAM-dependent methyltransferase
MSFARTKPAIARLHPEMQLGGFMAHDGTVEFYGRIKALARSEMRVVDLGAGRGAWFDEDDSDFRRGMRLLKGNVAEVVGCDVDAAVLHNRAVDRAVVLEPGRPWPFEDHSIDLVVSDYVLEHVEDPVALAAEVHRILRPGGWMCARTPTKHHYVSIAARLVSNLRHARVLAAAQPGRKAEDVFPTVYRLNTRSAIARAFDSSRFEDFSYIYCNEPQYHFGRAWVYRLFALAHRVLPAGLTGNLFVFLRKRNP